MCNSMARNARPFAQRGSTPSGRGSRTLGVWRQLLVGLAIVGATGAARDAGAADARAFQGDAPHVAGSSGALLLKDDIMTEKVFYWKSSDPILGDVDTGFVTATTWSLSGPGPSQLKFVGSGDGALICGHIVFGDCNRAVVYVVKCCKSKGLLFFKKRSRCVRYCLEGVEVKPITIIHDTSVIPPRAKEALDEDPLGVFSGIAQDKRMNVGLRVALEISAPGSSTVADIQWTIPGTIIKNYNITSAVNSLQGFLTECSTTPMSSSDLEQSNLFYHYTGIGISELSVSAIVDGFPIPMTASREFVVKRNPKAEIFYITGPGTSVNADIDSDSDVDFDDFLMYQTAYGKDNDPAGTTFFGVIGEHRFWHELVPETTPGGEFFRFHRGYIQKFNCWRGIFGYPCVKVYATAPNYVPATAEVNHAGMVGDGNGIIMAERHTGAHGTIYQLPLRFTIHGIPPMTPATNDFDSPGPGGEKKLSDFADVNALVNSIIGYHDTHHGRICASGDFAFSQRTPADPIFWRFHFMLTKVYELWQFLKLDGDTITVTATSPAGAKVFFPDQDLKDTGNCSSPTVVSCNSPSGSLFPIGTTNVTCTVEDVMRLDSTFPVDPALNHGTTKVISFDVEIVP